MNLFVCRENTQRSLAARWFIYPASALLAMAILTSAVALADTTTDSGWAFEETFDGDPGAPSQELLPRAFEYVATHRSHPKEQFTKSYAAYPADHANSCAGPDPSVSPLPQHEVFTTQTSNSVNPDSSFYICKNHMMSSMGQVEAYSNTLFWPRQEFDFSEGATLEFDVNINEGHTIRSWWEIVIAPRDQMRFAPAPLQSAVDETYPRDRIVLDFRGDVRQIRVGKDAIAPDGWSVEDRHFGDYDYLDWRDLYPDDPALEDRRIRRKMRVRLENGRITWGIETPDGDFDEFAVDIPGGLPFSRGVVQFKTHAYTPFKLANQSYYTFHWDNIRFSGPSLEPYEAFHADDVVYLQRDGHRPIGDEVTVNVNLPDELGANPVLTGQINASLNGQPLLSINGGPDIAIGLDDYPVENCASGQWRDWGSFRLPLESAVLRPGDNSFRWKVGPRPACALNHDWWDGYSVKFLHVQTDVNSGAEPEPPIGAVNERPTLTISSPIPSSVVAVEELVTLIATATDPKDGDLSARIRWLSDIDGPLGEGSTLTLTLSEGSHQITARVSDSGGLSEEAMVTVTVSEPSSDPAIEIIVDDRDSASVSRRGRWKGSRWSDPWAGRSLYSIGRSSTFRWKFDVPVRGTYDIYLWWTSDRRRSSRVPVTVSYNGGEDVQYRNQKDGGGRWQLLGSYALMPGGDHYVEVSAQNGQTAADAIRVIQTQSPNNGDTQN